MRKIFLTALLVIMMSAATALAAGWEQIYTDNNDNEIFFDPARVNVTSHVADTVEFNTQFRMVFSDRGRNAMIDWYRNNSIMPAGIEKLSYEVTTINFRKRGDLREYYVSSRTSYTANGVIISGMTSKNEVANWQTIPIASVVEVEYNNALLVAEGKDYN